MEHNGYGPMAFTPDRNPDGGLRIHLVHGERPSRDYGRNDSDKVRREVEATMAKAGVVMDRHDGSVVSMVRGDGKELIRSPVIKDRHSREVDVDVSGVGVLELVTEDGNDGANADWGVWIEPRLER